MKPGLISSALFALNLLMICSASVLGQTNKPAIEHESLMTMRFYEATGGFLVEGLEVVFPPANLRGATFEISKAAGGVVAAVPCEWSRSEVFLRSLYCVRLPVIRVQ